MVRWVGRLARLSASRADFQRQLESVFTLTVGDAVSRIEAPTLIVHSVGDLLTPVEIGRMLNDLIPQSTLVEFAGDDHFIWCQDNWQEICDTIVEFITETRPSYRSERRFATVMFTDIVDSTSASAACGDAKWRSVMEGHDRVAWQTTDAHHGRVVKSTGDGILATFETPSAAVDCARDLRRELATLGLKVRIGLHAGEIEVRDDSDVIGLADNIAARVEHAATPNAILASSTVRDLLAGGHFAFEPLGTYALKGIDGDWTLYSLA